MKKNSIQNYNELPPSVSNTIGGEASPKFKLHPFGFGMATIYERNNRSNYS